MTSHQKSEACSCGARIDIEGTEPDVIAACAHFREQHRTCGISPRSYRKP